MFYTITSPSKYHSTLANGKPNPKWTEKTVRESSDYLVNAFSSIRKKLQRKGLPWYGVRVAEPHHDGTVHWHLLCFMRHRDRAAITQVMREFAIREDRAELGKNVRARFDVVPVTKGKAHLRAISQHISVKILVAAHWIRPKTRKRVNRLSVKRLGNPLPITAIMPSLGQVCIGLSSFNSLAFHRVKPIENCAGWLISYSVNSNPKRGATPPE